MLQENQLPSVAQVYEGRTLFVTGASGFLGKVMLEKLLYSTEVKHIYILMRELKGHTVEERCRKLLSSPIFDRLRQSDAGKLDRVTAVAGDLLHDNLGLSEGNLKTLSEEVSIVFHCAATVRFDEILRVAIQMNLIGTQRLLKICKTMKNLVSLVHASTAYANCHLRETKEHVYKPPVDPEKLIDGLEWMSDDMIKSLTPHLLEERPNTYTLTKALTETQIFKEGGDLPLIIVRPSIITAVWQEPLPGWIDNYNGPTGIITAVGKGVITNMCGHGDSNADIIPVDIVSNMLIVAGAHRATTEYSEIPIIHCASGELNPIKWGRIVNFLQRFFHKYPFDDCLRAPSTYFHSSQKMFMFNFYYKHYIPARIMDAAHHLVGKKATSVKMYSRIWKMIETLHFFTTRGWTFESQNLLKLWNVLSDEDKITFNFDVTQIDWDDYLFDYVMGIRLYMLKEDLDNMNKARANLAWQKQVALYWNAAFWALIVRIFAWRRTRMQKWAVWLTGFISTYALQNVDFRGPVKLRSIEDYKHATRHSS